MNNVQIIMTIIVVVTDLCFVDGFANVIYVILFHCFLKKINHAAK